MKTHFSIPLLAVAGLLILVLGSAIADDKLPAEAPPGATSKPGVAAGVARKQWQHLALNFHFSENQQELAAKINELGREGWELVTVTESDRQGAFLRRTYYFKRPLL